MQLFKWYHIKRTNSREYCVAQNERCPLTAQTERALPHMDKCSNRQIHHLPHVIIWSTRIQVPFSK